MNRNAFGALVENRVRPADKRNSLLINAKFFVIKRETHAVSIPFRVRLRVRV